MIVDRSWHRLVRLLLYYSLNAASIAVAGRTYHASTTHETRTDFHQLQSDVEWNDVCGVYLFVLRLAGNGYPLILYPINRNRPDLRVLIFFMQSARVPVVFPGTRVPGQYQNTPEYNIPYSIGCNPDMPRRGYVPGTISYAFQAVLSYSKRDLNGITVLTRRIRGYSGYPRALSRCWGLLLCAHLRDQIVAKFTFSSYKK